MPADHQPSARRPRTAAWLLLTPLMLWLGAFVVAPLAIMAVYSVGRPVQPAGVRFTDPSSGTLDLSVEGYRQIFNLTLLQVLWRSALGAILGSGAVVGAMLLVGLFWRPLLEWTRRHWMAVAGVAFAAVGWGVLRQVVERVPGAGDVKIFVVSIDYAVWSTLICVLIGYPVGYFMGRASPRWRNILLVAVMVPFWTSFLIRTYAWLTILKSEGVLNKFLLWARMISEPLDLLYTPTAVMIGLVYTYLPFMILPIYTSCEKLDQSLIDASFDLGAGPFRSFWSVILPLTLPGVIAGVVITFVPAIGMFAVNDILGGRREPLIGNVITTQIVGQGRNLPYGAALGLVLMAIFLVVYYLAGRRRGGVVG